MSVRAPGRFGIVSAAAYDVLAVMADHAGVLRVPFDEDQCASVLRSFKGKSEQLIECVPDHVRDEIMETGLLCPLTRERLHYTRMGWQELGYDGTTAELWAFIQ